MAKNDNFWPKIAFWSHVRHDLPWLFKKHQRLLFYLVQIVFSPNSSKPWSTEKKPIKNCHFHSKKPYNGVYLVLYISWSFQTFYFMMYVFWKWCLYNCKSCSCYVTHHMAGIVLFNINKHNIRRRWIKHFMKEKLYLTFKWRIFILHPCIYHRFVWISWTLYFFPIKKRKCSLLCLNTIDSIVGQVPALVSYSWAA